MATWEDQSGVSRTARGALNAGAAVAAVLTLALSAGALAASLLPAIRQAGPAAVSPAPAAEPKAAPPPDAEQPEARQDDAPQFVVIFGDFTSRAQAQQYVRRIQSKGYLASIIPAGQSFLVVSRPYGSLEQAEFWRQVFEEIQLQTRATGELRDRGVYGRSDSL